MFTDAAAVGAVGIPVSVGLFNVGEVFLTNAVVAMVSSLLVSEGVGAVTDPVKVGLSRLAFKAKELVTLPAKSALSLIEAAISFSVSSVAGAESTNAATSVLTNCVVAS